MSDGQQNIPGMISTEGFPVVYVNLASLTVNFNDVRIYLADTQARTVATIPLPSAQAIPEAQVTPRICLVLTPEFAKNLLDTLSNTLALYEQQFGPLRTASPAPGQTPAPATRPATR